MKKTNQPDSNDNQVQKKSRPIVTNSAYDGAGEKYPSYRIVGSLARDGKTAPHPMAE